MADILIVDDEQNIRALLEKYATFEGHRVSTADNGMDALSLCKLHHYDIVVMDIMMPELDGFTTCREIKKISDIPGICYRLLGFPFLFCLTDMFLEKYIQIKILPF